jgi:hypothetical protein
MPSTSYRRKLRARQTLVGMPKYVDSLPSAVSRQKGECELEKIQNYFYTVLDLLTNHLNFTEAATTLTGIVSTLRTRVEFFTILDTIETNLLGTAINIMNGATSDIIKLRIDYIKSYIDTLPPLCQEPGPVSDMILQLLDTLIATMSTDAITNVITNIQSHVRKTYGHMESMEEIQSNLLNIVEVVGTSAPIHIIEMRVDFVRNLLDALNTRLA